MESTIESVSTIQSLKEMLVLIADVDQVIRGPTPLGNVLLYY
jgi:hypothetical protein